MLKHRFYILDEYGYYAVKGFAVVPIRQDRWVLLVFSVGQDLQLPKSIQRLLLLVPIPTLRYV